MINLRNKEFSDEDVAQITGTYHSWRCKGEPKCPPYEDKAGFCKSATLKKVRKNNYVLMPGRYVGTEAEEDDGIPFDEKMKDLTTNLVSSLPGAANLRRPSAET